MKRCCLLAVTLLLCLLSVPASALDLTEVPRTIGAEPPYEGTPRYGLLVFGPEGATRVWLVHDGPTLYADLNGDGDLTGPAERFAMHELSQPDQGVYQFEVGDVRDGERLHKRLIVGTMNLAHLAPTEPILWLELLKNPKARFYSLAIELELPGRRGAGEGGRVYHKVSPFDAHGLSQFADSPEAAPIYHLGGPWEITLFNPTTLTAGRTTDVYLGVGTPGLGPGTTAFAAYEKLVPAGKFPKVEVTLPDADEPIEYVLRQRCCTVNFHGGIALPADAPVGKGTVKVSFPDWLEGFVAPTTHEVRIARPRYQITLQPVSERLKATLTHPSRDGSLVGVAYSPDGKRIIAGDRPGGMIQQWDAETGEPLTLIETGYNERSPWYYFRISPDWQTVYVPRSVRTLERINSSGKQRIKWDFDAEIRRWDLTSGAPLPTLRQTPMRGISHLSISPGGRYLLLSNELPGTTEGQPERRNALWDVASQAARDLSDTDNFIGVFSPDDTRVAVPAADGRYSQAITLYATDTGQPTLSIPIEEEFAIVNMEGFSTDGKIVFATVRVYPAENVYDNSRNLLKFWDAASGELRGAIAADEGAFFGGGGALSSDGRLLAMPSWRGETGKVFLADVHQGALVRTIEPPEEGPVRQLAFTPDGRWLVAITQEYPENPPRDLSALDLPQPRIHLIESATGEIHETLVAPQGVPTSMAFSPDGRRLAVAGMGRVYLWDLSIPPAE